jgi:hypothetical protein
MVKGNRIPFSNFSKPLKIEKENGFLKFQTDLSIFNGKKLFQNIFIYWIIEDSIISDRKGIIRFYITGDGIKGKPLYRKSVFESFGKIGWSLRLPDIIKNFVVLCNFSDGLNSNLNEAYYSLNNSLKRKDKKLCFSRLMEAVKIYGFPEKDHDIFYEYVDDDRYKNKFGYEPHTQSESDNLQLETEMFNLLEMNPTEDPELIKSSYRKMVRKYHPDLSENADNTEYTKKIKEINAAYEYLQKRFN